MKNIYEVLRKKEDDMQRVQVEIEALRTAAHLLAEDGDADTSYLPRTTVSPAAEPHFGAARSGIISVNAS
jgi:hypothetical protein